MRDGRPPLVTRQAVPLIDDHLLGENNSKSVVIGEKTDGGEKEERRYTWFVRRCRRHWVYTKARAPYHT